MKSLVLAVTILMAAPAFAQTTKLNWDKATAVSVSFTDEFFNDNDHFKLSGSEQSAWSAIHLAVVASLNDPQNFGIGGHARWPANRGKTVPGCKWCAAELRVGDEHDRPSLISSASV
jgi:hypothetical protein